MFEKEIAAAGFRRAQARIMATRTPRSTVSRRMRSKLPCSRQWTKSAGSCGQSESLTGRRSAGPAMYWRRSRAPDARIQRTTSVGNRGRTENFTAESSDAPAVARGCHAQAAGRRATFRRVRKCAVMAGALPAGFLPLRSRRDCRPMASATRDATWRASSPSMRSRRTANCRVRG